MKRWRRGRPGADLKWMKLWNAEVIERTVHIVQKKRGRAEGGVGASVRPLVREAEEKGLCRGLQATQCQEETSFNNMQSLREGVLRMKVEQCHQCVV